MSALSMIAPDLAITRLAHAPEDGVGPPAAASPVAPGGAAGLPSFGTVLRQQLGELDQTMKAAQGQSLRLAAGQADSLHQVMISLEQARIAFQLALQVRNRVMEALQEVQRMQL